MREPNRKRKHDKSPGQALRNRAIWTIGIHLFAAGVFACVYAIPSVFAWVQRTEYRSMGARAPMGIILLILPALFITFLWGGADLRQKGIASKLLLSLCLILNVVISITYLVLIDNFFTHRLF